MLEVLKSFLFEIPTLYAVISNYREFLLGSDSNPYVRTRLGFTEWVVGPEPVYSKRLKKLIYETEHIDLLFQELVHSIEYEPKSFSPEKLEKYSEQVDKLLHEMGQPLTSKNRMHSYVKKILNYIKELDELGTTNPLVVEFIGKTLSKILRTDWKYHVVFEIEDFKDIFKIHQGIVGYSENRQQLNRLHKFKKLISQIEEWIKSKTIQTHFFEIETDMNDIKGYLQDFLAYVQRLKIIEDSNEQLTMINEIHRQLLEYRYVFGKFFHGLHHNDDEERSLRNQFLFVNQYFESVEVILQDLKTNVY